MYHGCATTKFVYHSLYITGLMKKKVLNISFFIFGYMISREDCGKLELGDIGLGSEVNLR